MEACAARCGTSGIAAGRPQAFTQWVPARDLDGTTLDVMRRNPDHDLPNGIMDFLVIETITHVAATSGGGLTLDFATMRTIVSGEGAGWLARLGRTATVQGSGQAQIQSLWRFNATYRRRWVPRYVVPRSIDALPRQGLVMADAEGLQ